VRLVGEILNTAEGEMKMEFKHALKKDEKEGKGTMELTIPYGEFGGYFDRAGAIYMKEGEVPGFRKGKAPRPRVIAHYSQDAVRDFALRLLACEAITEALEEESVSASGKVHFAFSPVEKDKPIEVTVSFNLGQPGDEPELPWPQVGDEGLDDEDKPYGPAPDYLRRARK